MSPPCGHLEVITGCMFAGKTDELFRRVRRARHARRHVQLFKHRRAPFHGTNTGTHDRLVLPATAVADEDELRGALEAAADVVAIDEVHFFGMGVTTLVEEFVAAGKVVICAGLDLDFRGEPFAPMPRLLAIADVVHKLNAICVDCGDSATRSQRMRGLFDTDDTGDIGDYQAKCRIHFRPYELL